jgi:hypothetical protein
MEVASNVVLVGGSNDSYSFHIEDPIGDTFSTVISRRTTYDILRNDAATSWKQLPPHLQVDKELVLHV